MYKRLAAALLWLFAGWYVGAALAAFLGLPEFVGLLIGVAMAGVIAGDPLQRLWTPASRTDTGP